MNRKLNILVSNDDGIDSPGIAALVHSLKGLGNVIVVAPDRQQSAVGHSLTISDPLRAVPVHRDGDFFGYAVNGTPSDCVKLALAALLPWRPDILVAGINHGQNTAVNILYSGTVSCATEGMLSGVPSMAVSLASHDYGADFSASAKYACLLAEKLLDMNLPKDTLLNVNIPNIKESAIKGMKVVKHNSTIWKDAYEKRNDPFGREYFWFSGEYLTSENDIEADDYALQHGFVTVNPIHYNITNKEYMDKLRFLEEI